MAGSSSRRGVSGSGNGDFITRIHNMALETPTSLDSLPGGHQASRATRVDPGSSSDESGFGIPSSGSALRRHGHSRSLSNPLSSIFNSKKRGNNSSGGVAQDYDELYETSVNVGKPGQSSSKRGVSSAGDFATGTCMTCGSLMRWPQHVHLFKCTKCAMINDLAILGSENLSGADKGSRRETREHRPTNTEQLSLDHTRTLIRQCLVDFLSKRLCHTQQDQHEARRDGAAHAHGETTLHPGWQPQHSHEAHEAYAVNPDHSGDGSRYAFHEHPTLRPNPLKQPRSSRRSHSSSHTQRQDVPQDQSRTQRNREQRISSHSDEPTRIFKPLEEYILSRFSTSECLNCSFMSRQKRATRSVEPDPFRRKPVPSRQPSGQRLAQDSDTLNAYSDGPLPDQSSRVPLFGSHAAQENRWPNQRHRLNSQVIAPAQDERAAPASVTSKSPNIQWDELGEWYSAVINAAEGWFGVYEEMSMEPDFEALAETELRAIEQDLLRGQEHTRRHLLKATESLLKRPGGPIRKPADVRYLLVLIENPLLMNQEPGFQGLLQPDMHFSHTHKGKGHKGSAKSGLLSGQHSGIIKRLIGLMSEAPVDCHNQVTVWLSRYSRNRFVQIKELVSGFLTYRMLRQNDRARDTDIDVTAGLIPELHAGGSGAYLHDEIGMPSSSRKPKEAPKKSSYMEDWQVRSASRVLALIFAANNLPHSRRGESITEARALTATRDGVFAQGQLLPTSDFYHTMIDYADPIADFEAWDMRRSAFSFCQYPFLLSIWAKTKILEYDAKRQMQSKARDAFFDSIMSHKNVKQYLTFDVRRDCVVDDSLNAVSEVIGNRAEDIKKGLRIIFRGEEGIDGGGLRKEWFLLLTREVFNPDHGMFVYDEDSNFCYFNPNSLETSDQFFLVGVVLGLAIYNSTILDVAFPPFTFRKLLASAPALGGGATAHPRPVMKYTLEDLAEYRPRLAHGLRQLLEFEGDVETTFYLHFVLDTERYGTVIQVPLCHGGERKAVNNLNRKEYVDLYVRYVLDTAVARQFEPFKRGFYTVAGGNAFSLLRPEEIELLIRGSDEALDVDALRAVAEYQNWNSQKPDGSELLIEWFWDTFKRGTPSDQRRLLSFITGSDRVPAMGAAMLNIKISCLGEDCARFPIARTCFNLLSLWRYGSRAKLEYMLWTAVRESEGFGLK